MQPLSAKLVNRLVSAIIIVRMLGIVINDNT